MVESVLKVCLIALFISIAIGVIGTSFFSWTLDTSPYLSGLASFLHVIFYVLPIGKLSPIIYCFLGFMAFRIAISIIKTLWRVFNLSS